MSYKLVNYSKEEEKIGQNGPSVKTELPGPKSREIWNKTGKYHSPGLSAVATESQLVMDEGKGSYVRDIDGNIFLDFCSGGIPGIIGHSHPRLRENISTEMNKFVYIYDWMTEARSDFFEELAKVVPSSIERFQMFTGGTETVEAALRLSYSHSKKQEFMSLYNGFHGKSLASRSLLGGGYKTGFGTPAPGYYQTPNPYCYRCPLNLEPSSCGGACADMVQKVYEQQTSGKVAALIMEPIQGAGGVIPLPKEFVQRMKKFCEDNNILFIFDEILTSYGRTGKMFAWEHTEVEPDIMTMGKGVGGGFPLSILGSREEIMDEWPWNQPAGGSTTFGGGNLAAIAGLTTLQVIQEENLVENSASIGKYIKDKLIALQDKYEVLGDVRGEGMMIGMEFVTSRQSKEPINGEQAKYFYHETLKRGLLLASMGHIVRLTPPIIMTKEQAEIGLGILEKSIAALQEKVSKERNIVN
jgi:4-aminobutyrate aminotransferase-like enzyme